MLCKGKSVGLIRKMRKKARRLGLRAVAHSRRVRSSLLTTGDENRSLDAFKGAGFRNDAKGRVTQPPLSFAGAASLYWPNGN